MALTPDKSESDSAQVLLPCPFCGDRPDASKDETFRYVDGYKWGAVSCCCDGPGIRTGYGEISEWKADAITAWNARAQNTLEAENARLREALERISDEIAGAMQSDCENGVRWLNERAAADYLKGFPATKHAVRLCHAIAEDTLQSISGERE